MARPSIQTYNFRDEKLQNQALTHRSHNSSVHNERLEFLGDAVLSGVAAHYLVNKYPFATEGDLSRLRSVLVCNQTLARLAKKMGLDDLIKTNHSGKMDQQKLLSNTFEALVGAIFLDSKMDFQTMQDMLHPDFESCIKELNLPEEDEKRMRLNEIKVPATNVDPIQALQTYAQQKHLGVPYYNFQTLKDGFVATVYLQNHPHGTGQARRKKDAKKEASRQALILFNNPKYSSLYNAR